MNAEENAGFDVIGRGTSSTHTRTNSRVTMADNRASEIATIKEYIESNHFSHKMVPATSRYWSYFHRIFDNTNQVLPNFAFCLNCNDAILLGASGTTELIRHLKKTKCTNEFPELFVSTPRSSKKKRYNASSEMRDDLQSTPKGRRLNFDSPSKDTLQSKKSDSLGNESFDDKKHEIKSMVLETLIRWIAKDMRPFRVASTDQFTNLCQLFVNIGAKYGSIDVKDVIPHENTISNGVDRIYNELKETVKTEVKNAAINGMFCDYSGFAWHSFYLTETHPSYFHIFPMFPIELAFVYCSVSVSVVELTHRLSSNLFQVAVHLHRTNGWIKTQAENSFH